MTSHDINRRLMRLLDEGPDVPAPSARQVKQIQAAIIDNLKPVRPLAPSGVFLLALAGSGGRPSAAWDERLGYAQHRTENRRLCGVGRWRGSAGCLHGWTDDAREQIYRYPSCVACRDSGVRVAIAGLHVSAATGIRFCFEWPDVHEDRLDVLNDHGIPGLDAAAARSRAVSQTNGLRRGWIHRAGWPQCAGNHLPEHERASHPGVALERHLAQFTVGFSGRRRY